MPDKKENRSDDLIEKNPEPGDRNDGDMTHFGFRQVPETEKVSWVVRHFNTVADKYDFMNTLLSFGIHHLWKRSSINIMDLESGDKIIDVCGGTGDLSLRASRNVGASGRVVLFDMNRAMMEQGRPKVDTSPFPESILFVQGDAECISFKDNTFDAATVGFGVRNLTHLEAGLKEIYRILKPGGKFMCLEFSRPTMPVFRWLYDLYSFYIMPFLGQVIGGSRDAYTYLPESIRLFPSPDKLVEMLERIGFTDVTFKRQTNGIAVIHVGTKKR